MLSFIKILTGTGVAKLHSYLFVKILLYKLMMKRKRFLKLILLRNNREVMNIIFSCTVFFFPVR